MNHSTTAYNREDALNKRNDLIGTLPDRFDTVLADVLGRLLEGGAPLTAMVAAQAHGTARLSAVIHTLEKKYGWHIERAQTKKYLHDGRYVWTTAYKLPQVSIEGAREMYGSMWMDIVKMFHSADDNEVRQRAFKKAFADLTWRDMIKIVLDGAKNLLGWNGDAKSIATPTHSGWDNPTFAKVKPSQAATED